jgi:hypothetical protein
MILDGYLGALCARQLEAPDVRLGELYLHLRTFQGLLDRGPGWICVRDRLASLAIRQAEKRDAEDPHANSFFIIVVSSWTCLGPMASR